MTPRTLITGFPRIGEKRELKKVLEDYFANRISFENVGKTALSIKRKNWQIQKEKGIDLISCNDFSLYDNMLDTAVAFNAIPRRFRNIATIEEKYFAMARGNSSTQAMEMSKWFNTNYHYIVPELDCDIEFQLNAEKIFMEYNEALRAGIKPKINIIGLLTFLSLSKFKKGYNLSSFYEPLLVLYKKLLREVSKLNDIVYVQIEEPVFVKNPSDELLVLLKKTYEELSSVSTNIRLIVTTYYEHSVEATKILGELPLWGIGLDFIAGRKNLESLKYIKDKKLIAGVVNGRNIWINDIFETLNLLNKIVNVTDREQILVSTSCSLLHVPYSLYQEPDSKIRQWLSFACEKVDEVAMLGKLLHSDAISEREAKELENYNRLIEEQSSFYRKRKEGFDLSDKLNRHRDGNYFERLEIQAKQFKLPKLPATTIGSFPQTIELRKLRKQFKGQSISSGEYEEGIKQYIDSCIDIQEEIGLDVLVHGEPERNDMVEFFGEMLEGFHFTKNGWVQSYGTRCVKPPIIYDDIKRISPMTVKWITYAQGRTQKPVKGMLTGPVTILNWSFSREDVSRSEIAGQIALALRAEIADLQTAGIRIIQVDEAAIKEGFPLRKENAAEYERWAVSSFNLAVSGARKETQIHTHMCYSDFRDIITLIHEMDADVTTIEASKSRNSLLEAFRENRYEKQIGPGVYDIHSSRVPTVDEFVKEICIRLEFIPIKQLWINPDCGLKTRNWIEVMPALTNMVQAVKRIRSWTDYSKTIKKRGQDAGTSI